MKAQRDYHDKTPELAKRLGDDIAAALRMGLLFTVTSVPTSEWDVDEDTVRFEARGPKVRYYFEAQFPDAPDENADEFLTVTAPAVAEWAANA